MIALTSRLNERDETIIGLQEETELLVKNVRSQEDTVEELSNRNRYLESKLQEHNVDFDKDQSQSLHFEPLLDSRDDFKSKAQNSGAESECLKDVLGVLKIFLDRNDRKQLIDNVESLSNKYNLNGVFGNVQQLKDISVNENIGSKSVEQMIHER